MTQQRHRLGSIKPLFWGMLVLLGGIWLLHSLTSTLAIQQLSYRDFKHALRQDQLQDVQISKDMIQGTRRVFSSSMRLHLTDGMLSPQRVRFQTVRVEDPKLIQELEAHQVPYRGQMDRGTLKKPLTWLVLSILLVVLLVCLAVRRRAGQGLMNFGKSRARIYMEKEAGVGFAAVAGVDEAKAELQEIIDFLCHPENYALLGGRIPKGMLLVGPPGTGKTLLARAVAGEAAVPFLSLNGSDFVEMFIGVGAARVRDLFQQAEAKAPAIVFIDELDAIGKARGANSMPQHHDREQTLNQLLAEIDGFDSCQGVIVLAATNRPEVLDPALLRAGRFDRQVVVDRPDFVGRLQILRLYANKVRMASGVDLEEIAMRTPGMVGADLANVINEAALLAARYSQTEVTMEVLDEAIDRILAGPKKKSRVMAPVEKRRVAYHESGHAMVAQLLPTTDPVRRVTIIPHGKAALGYMQQQPAQDRYLYTKAELLDRMTVLLSGRAAEHVIFQDYSTGAQDDLQKASALARRMVMAFGMGEQLGLYTVDQKEQPLFLPGATRASQTFSEATTHTIDQEAQQIVKQMADRAYQLIEARQETLEKLAHDLLLHETLDQRALLALLGDRHLDTESEPQNHLQ
jgi:cell division protease FtsH